MIDPVILKDTQKSEWETIRRKIYSRIYEGIGGIPSEPKVQFTETSRYQKYGLTHIEISYLVYQNTYANALIILPEDFDSSVKYPGVITIHGTNDLGKYSLTDLENRPERAYPIDLAKRGYVAVAPDQYGFGNAMENKAYREEYNNFYTLNPQWTLTARRLLAHIKLIDVLETIEYIDSSRLGGMGNSLGGAAVMYLTAMDERIGACVMSTGISPNVTNVYRSLNRVGSQEVDLRTAVAMKEKGVAPWELSEVLSLCAPRAIMCIEPFNDPYNPYTMISIECVHKAWEVYNLLECPEKLSLYVHGDGHDTVESVRTMAYNWFDRFFK